MFTQNDPKISANIKNNIQLVSVSHKNFTINATSFEWKLKTIADMVSKKCKCFVFYRKLNVKVFLYKKILEEFFKKRIIWERKTNIPYKIFISPPKIIFH